MKSKIFIVLTILGSLIYFAPFVWAQTLTINGSIQYQTMDGFGAYDNQGQSNPPNYAWPTSVANLLFQSPPNGIGLSILRVVFNSAGEIGGTCPAPTPDGTWNDALLAQSYGAKIFASTWTAPPAWKTVDTCPNYTDGASTPDGSLQSQYYTDWANLFTTFINSAKANGINLAAVSLQNEPDQGNVDYPQMYYTQAQLASFAEIAAPIINATGVPMAEPEASDWDWSYATAIHPTSAQQYVGYYFFHQYSGVQPPTYTDHHIWMTEYEETSQDTSINAAVALAQTIDSAIQTGDVSAWVYWTATNCGTNPALISVACGGGGSPTSPIAQKLSALGNWSAFVRPGYIRVGVTGSIANNQIEAYINPNNNNPTIIIINTTGSAEPITVALQNASASTMTPWITNSSLTPSVGNAGLQEGTPVSVSNNSFSYTVTGYSITTLVGSGSGGPTPTPTQIPTQTPTPKPTSTPGPGVNFRGIIHGSGNTVPIPTNVQLGDLLLLTMQCYEGAVPSLPLPWTQLISVNNTPTNDYAWAGYKLASSTDAGGSYTTVACDSPQYVLRIYYGENQSNPIDASAYTAIP